MTDQEANEIERRKWAEEHASLDAFVAKVEASSVDVMRETLKDARTAVDVSLEAVRMLRDQQQARGRQALNLIADRLDVASSKLYEATQYPAYTQAQRDSYAAEAVKQERERAGWQPIETAPRDGTPILGYCVHSDDAYYEEEGHRLTDYGARAEGLSHVEDGAHVLIWDDAYECSDGWEMPSCTIPAWWTLAYDAEVTANPTHWQPIAPPPKDQP